MNRDDYFLINFEAIDIFKGSCGAVSKIGSSLKTKPQQPILAYPDL